jgi:hypothetical protein
MAQVCVSLSLMLSEMKKLLFSMQHEYNATQVPAEWHSWLQHIRKQPPVEDPIMQQSVPKWKAVRVWLSFFLYFILIFLSFFCCARMIALG